MPINTAAISEKTIPGKGRSGTPFGSAPAVTPEAAHTFTPERLILVGKADFAQEMKSILCANYWKVAQENLSSQLGASRCDLLEGGGGGGGGRAKCLIHGDLCRALNLLTEARHRIITVIYFQNAPKSRSGAALLDGSESAAIHSSITPTKIGPEEAPSQVYQSNKNSEENVPAGLKPIHPRLIKRRRFPGIK